MIGAAIAIYPIDHAFGRAATRGLLIGCGVAFFVVTASFFTLAWAFDKSTKVFMKAFAAGLLGRLTVMAVTVIVVSQFESVHLVTAAVSLLAFYGLLTFLEIRFFSALLKAMDQRKTA